MRRSQNRIFMCRILVVFVGEEPITDRLFLTHWYHGQKPDHGKFEHVQRPVHRTGKFFFLLDYGFEFMGTTRNYKKICMFFEQLSAIRTITCERSVTMYVIHA